MKCNHDFNIYDFNIVVLIKIYSYGLRNGKMTH